MPSQNQYATQTPAPFPQAPERLHTPNRHCGPPARTTVGTQRSCNATAEPLCQPIFRTPHNICARARRHPLVNRPYGQLTLQPAVGGLFLVSGLLGVVRRGPRPAAEPRGKLGVHFPSRPICSLHAVRPGNVQAAKRSTPRPWRRPSAGPKPRPNYANTATRACQCGHSTSARIANCNSPCGAEAMKNDRLRDGPARCPSFHFARD